MSFIHFHTVRSTYMHSVCHDGMGYPWGSVRHLNVTLVAIAGQTLNRNVPGNFYACQMELQQPIVILRATMDFVSKVRIRRIPLLFCIP
jgi:hypothetical protein